MKQFFFGGLEARLLITSHYLTNVTEQARLRVSSEFKQNTRLSAQSR
ncbi:hypothetical protein N574_00640 [Lactiplantibacillus plantarum 2165]|nr:hypothetical protein N574_00640 [Lactiplantibacillus plantarum 2165]